MVAICALTISLATRYYTPASSHPHMVKVERRSLDPERQHLAKDATRWMAPVAEFTLLDSAIVYPYISFSTPLFSNDLFAESFYTRPPPSSAILL